MTIRPLLIAFTLVAASVGPVRRAAADIAPAPPVAAPPQKQDEVPPPKPIEAAPTPAKPDKEGFVPVTTTELASGEQLPAKDLVAAAYGFILACLVVWVASVAVRSRKVEDELEALRRKIDKQA